VYRASMIKKAKARKYSVDWSEMMKKRWSDPKFRAKCIASAKRRHKNPADRASILAALAKGRANTNPVTARAARIAANVRSWQDPVSRAKRLKALRHAVRTPEHRAKQAAIFRAKWQSSCLYIRGTRYVEMRSWWEVAYAEWLDKQQIAWVYESINFDIGFSHDYPGNLYGPDFYLPDADQFVEIKGRQSRRYKGEGSAYGGGLSVY
jgi:hypothetical protein